MGKRAALAVVSAAACAAMIPAEMSPSIRAARPEFPFTNGNSSCLISRSGFTFRFGVPPGAPADAQALPAARHATVGDGLLNWNLLRNEFNQPLYNVSQATSGTVWVYQRPNSATSSNAYATCSGTLELVFMPRSYVNSDLSAAQNTNRLRGIASHEAGHVLGLSHTGRRDNTASISDLPYMATCVSAADRAASSTVRPKIDDAAQAARWRRGHLNANAGFEQLTSGMPSYWESTQATRVTGSPQSGASYMSLGDNGSRLDQRVHVQ